MLWCQVVWHSAYAQRKLQEPTIYGNSRIQQSSLRWSRRRPPPPCRCLLSYRFGQDSRTPTMRPTTPHLNTNTPLGTSHLLFEQRGHWMGKCQLLTWHLFSCMIAPWHCMCPQILLHLSCYRYHLKTLSDKHTDSCWLERVNTHCPIRLQTWIEYSFVGHLFLSELVTDIEATFNSPRRSSLREN